jgi:hypothetical protein
MCVSLNYDLTLNIPNCSLEEIVKISALVKLAEFLNSSEEEQ